MIPIFPLSNVVLFPNVFLPLHIFEDRYRAMVQDALAGDRIIGMVLLREGAEAQAEPAPPVYSVGCSGLITHAEPLRDGRFNIVLRGLERFRILGEDHSRPYRRARVDALPERVVDLGGDENELHRQRQRLEQAVDERLKTSGSDAHLAAAMADADLVNALAQYLELEPVEQQALLERDTVVERCRSLVDLLEMRAMIDGRGFSESTVQ